VRCDVLGCCGGIGEGRETTAFMLNERVLIDAGTGVGRMSLPQMGAINHVFLTHAHMDHVAALPMMVDNRHDAFKRGELPQLHVYGCALTLAVLREHIFNWSLWPNFLVLPTPARPVLRLHEIASGDVIEVDGLSIEAVRVNHEPSGLGFIVTGGEQVMAFSGDTTTNTTLWAALNRLSRLDYLVIECAFPNAQKELAILASHYAPDLLAADLKRLRHKPRLGLTHFKPGREAVLMQECTALLKAWRWEPLTPGTTIELLADNLTRVA
jgi:ribonuclease BN (tRNA processing enzyme)